MSRERDNTGATQRATRVIRTPLQPPRGLKHLGGVISWEPPSDTTGITHYRVYLNTEFNLVREVSNGQTEVRDLSGERIFVSSYNANLERESRKVPLTGGVTLTSPERFGGVGDAITVTAGVSMAIGSRQVVLPSTSRYLFDWSDIGKLIVVKNAIVGGKDLEGVIESIVSAHIAVASVAAGAAVTNGEATWGTNNISYLLDHFTYSEPILLGIGRYLVNGQLPMRNILNFSMTGEGPGSILMPTPSLANNFMDVSGSRNMGIKNFQIDGRYFPDLSLECIYGDGTAENPVYGNITVEDVIVSNFRPLVFGIGANAGKTAERITYNGCVFYNCSSGSFEPNTIDTGSSGTKRNYKILNCNFIYVTQPASNPGNAIFAGHGDNENFTISGNHGYDCPSTFINVHNRPYSGEATRLVNFNVVQNICYRPRWNGVSVFGGERVTVALNQIYNPGFGQNATVETRCGILLSTQHSGATPTKLAIQNLIVDVNQIIDDQGTPTMKYGILEAIDSPGAHPAGVIGPSNRIIGYEIADIGGIDAATSRLAILRHHPGSLDWRFGFGDFDSGYSTKARVSADGDLRAKHQTVDLFVQSIIKAAQESGEFQLGQGFNIWFNSATGQWISGTDGSSNGWAALLLAYGAATALRVYGKASTGASAQTFSTLAGELGLELAFATLGFAYNKFFWKGVGHFLDNLSVALGATDAVPNPNYALDVGSKQSRFEGNVGFGGQENPARDIDLAGIARIRGLDATALVGTSADKDLQSLDAAAVRTFADVYSKAEIASLLATYVTVAQHNAHDHQYDGTGGGTALDYTGSANPAL